MPSNVVQPSTGPTVITKPNIPADAVTENMVKMCGTTFKKPAWIAGLAAGSFTVILITVVVPIYVMAPGVHVCTTALADVAIVLDESGSIEAEDFIKEKDFAVALAQEFDINLKTIRVGVMTYASQPTIHNNFGTINNMDEMTIAMDGIFQTGGGTATDLAIDSMRTQMMVDPHVRDLVIQYCVLVTDGASNNINDTTRAAERAHGEGIEMFAIGVGEGVNLVELQAIASRPEYVLQVEDFNSLQIIAKEVADLTCTHISNLIDEDQK